MEKSPFSLYDFLGYFFPGAFMACIFSLFYISHMCLGEITINNLIKSFIELKTVEIHFSFLIIVVITCYILGHILAYLSSITIERFGLWLFGYPSEFLLGQRKLGYWNCKISTSSSEDNTENECCYAKCVRYSLRFIMLILLLPISVFHMFFKIIKFNKFIVKPLDSYISTAIQLKIENLIKNLKLPIPKEKQKIDFSRLIVNFVYERQKNHCKKLDNYVALYGFLRAMTLVFNFFVVFLLIYLLVCKFSFEMFNLLVFLSFLSYVLFLSFLKFYRRYTLEGFMCLITDETLK